MGETDPLDERQLVRGYLHGDPGATRAIDDWIDAGLRAQFASLRAEWDDLRQEVRTRLVDNFRRNRFDGRASLRTYVNRITRNTCVDLTRRAFRRREAGLDDREQGLVDERWPAQMSAHIAHDVVVKILAELSGEDRHLLALVFEENCSYAEVARRLGITEAAVKTRVFRCKERVLRHYERLTRGGR